MRKNTTKLAPVISLQDLYVRACKSPEYRALAMVAARTLGGMNITNLDLAMRWLRINATDLDTDEEGVVDEINFCR